MEKLLGKAKSLRLLVNSLEGLNMCQTRSYNVSRYKTKSQRIRKSDISPNNKKWAPALLDGMEKLKSIESSEPHMIHVVSMRKSTKGRPWWEKEIVAELGLEGKIHRPVLLKNIPGINKMLNEIKHIVKILPLKIPLGLPQHSKEFESMVLKSNGELVFQKYMECHEEGDKVQTEQEQTLADTRKLGPEWTFQRDTLQKTLDRQVQLYRVNLDQFPTKYEYKLNQDGKMYRYQHKDVRKHLL